MLLLILFYKVFEHETVWIQIRPYILPHDFVWPDLGLKCMQNLPADKTIANKALKYAMNRYYCTRRSRKFCQRRSNFDKVIFLVDEGISGAFIGPSAKRHLSGLLLACR